MPPDVTPALIAAAASQLAFVVAGVVVLWRCRFSPAARRAVAPSPLADWAVTLPDFLAACLIVIAGALGVQMGAGMLLQSTHPGGSGSDAAWLLLMGAAFQLGLFTGAVAAGAYLRTRTLRPLDPPPAPSPAPVRSGVLRAGALTFVAALPLILVINLPWVALLEALGVPTAKQELVDVFRNADSPFIVGLIVVLAVVAAPITEELIFRAGLFRYLRTRVPRWVALLLPSVLFGALHGNYVAFLPLVVLGVVFSIAYERTGRIAVPMIAHGLFNLNTLLLLAAGVEV